MALSMDLISQFVKITKDRPSEKKETMLYGTVKDYQSNLYVKIDGSDLLTPYISTADVKSGDRVTLTIKNHNAIITGNLSDKSASSTSVGSVANTVGLIGSSLDDLSNRSVTTEQLNATNARIGTLEADKVKITGRLEAVEADIDTLTADHATFKTATVNRLTAAEANIGELTAKNADITGRLTAAEGVIANLDSVYIKVDELDAITGSITNLDSKYAKITELNSAKADIATLESEVANIDTLIFGSATGTTIQTSFSNSIIAQLGDAQIKSAMIESVSASKITAGDIITNNVKVKSNNGRLLISDETLQISDTSRVRVQIGKDASNDYSINIWDQNGNLMFSKGGITDSAIKEAIIRNDMVSDTANIAAHKLDIDSLFDEINDSTNTIKSTKVYLDEEGQTLDVAFKTLGTTITEHGKTVTSQGTAISAIQGQITSKIWKQDIDEATDEMSTQYSTLEQSLNSYKTTVGETYATKTKVNGLETAISQNTEAIGLKASKTEVATAKSEAISAANTNTANSLKNYSTTSQMDAAINLKVDSITNTVSSTYVTKTALEEVNNDIAAEITDLDSRVTSAETNITQLSNKITANVTETTNLGTRMTTVEQTASGLATRITNTESDVLDAAKTATDYLQFSSAGLIVGDMTASTLGKNVLIDSDSVDIRNGETTLASFGADYLYLAKNSRDATIDLCNGLAQMYHTIDGAGYSIFNIDTTYGLSYIKMSAPMHDMLVLENTATTDCVVVKGMIHGTTVGGFGLHRDGYMIRYGSDADDDNPVENVVLDTGNYLDETDSGWKYSGGYGDNFTQYNNEEYAKVRYRKIGRIVEIRGVVRPTTTIAGGTTQHEIFRLAEGYRPDSYMYQRCSGSGSYTWLLTVSTGGVVSFSRYGNGTSYIDVDTTAWLPFQITFFTD